MNRGGRGHFGRLGPVGVRAKVVDVGLSEGKPRLAGGVLATEKAVVTPGPEVAVVELKAVAARRNGSRENCFCIVSHDGVKLRVTVYVILGGEMGRIPGRSGRGDRAEVR